MSVTHDMRQGPLHDAFAMIDLAFAHMRGAPDTATAAKLGIEEHTAIRQFLSHGGPMVLPDEQYVREFFRTVNGIQSIVADTSGHTSPDSPSNLEVDLEHLRAALEEIFQDPAAARRRNASKWNASLKGRVLQVPFLDPETQEVDRRTIVLDGPAAVEYLLTVCATEPFCDQLHRCRLETCKHFFLFKPDRRGPPPKYCVDKDCAAIACKEQVQKRVSKHRAKVAKSRFRKSI